MTIEQITDIAYQVVSELEPAVSFDVFHVSDSQILFQGEQGLKRVCLSCLNSDSLKEQIKAELWR
jgi:hypothetical protein